MNIFARILGSLEARLVPPRLRILRTIYANFRLLPLRQAIKLPIFIYGHIRLYMLNGTVEFRDTHIKTGMIKIGKADPFLVSSGEGFISLSGPASKIIFKGPSKIGAGIKLHMFGGNIVFGKNTYLATDVTLICNGEHIRIGDYTRIAIGTLLLNSSFHSVINLKTKHVGRNTKPIEIGKNCWIANRCNIAAGTKLKDWTIVGANSLVNKDYTIFKEDYQLIGGNPAKIIKSGLQRVFSSELEQEIYTFFSHHPTMNLYKIESDDPNKPLDKNK